MKLLLRGVLAIALLVGVLVQAGLPREAEAQDTMTFAVHTSLVPRWLDPAEAAGQYTGFLPLYAIYDALVKPMPGEHFSPSIAESWEVVDGGKVYEFKLREGITFHNGDPLTSEDVKFSFERYRKNSPEAPLMTHVVEVETPSPHVVRFVLDAPWPDFMAHFGGYKEMAGWIVPKKYIEEVGEEGFANHPIGSGPYKFVSFTPGVELKLERFDDFWRKKPNVKNVVLKSVPDELTRVAMIKRGEVDAAMVFKGLAAKEVQDTEGVTLVPSDPPADGWLVFTEQFDPDSPWSDVKVRKAASVAINREAIIQALYLGYGKATSTIVPSTFEYAWEPDPIPYDPEMAKQLLADAGYPDGFDGGILYTDIGYADVAEAAANDLSAVGIRVELRPLERPTFFGQWAKHELTGGLVLGLTGSHGNAAMRIKEYIIDGGRYTYQGYPELNELFEQQATEMDNEKRAEILEELQRKMHEKVVVAPVIKIVGLSAKRDNVEESGLAAIEGYSNIAPYEDLKFKE